jgi:hypothetical protein
MIAFLVDPVELTEQCIAIPQAIDPLFTPRPVPMHRFTAADDDPVPSPSVPVTVWRLWSQWGDSAIYLKDGER